MTTSALFVTLAATASAAPQEPVVYAVAWGEVREQFFPHPSLCVGAATVDRQRDVGPGYRFDPDGCGSGDMAVVGFVDRDGSDTRSFDDPIYVQARGALRVGAGDLRITEGAPVVVRSSDADAGLDLRHIGSTWDLLDNDADKRWSPGDTAYLDADENGFLSPGDLVIEDALRRVPLGAPGMFYPLGPATGGLCFVDDDGSSRWDPGEPAYLVLGRPCDQVAAGDQRIVTTRGQLPGSHVIEAAFDYRNPLTAFPAPQGLPAAFDGTAVLDLDGSGTLTPADRLVHGLAAPQQAAAEPLDIGGAWAFLDLDGEGRAGPGDLVYIDRDGNGHSSAGDVRLHQATGHPFGSIIASGDAEDVRALPAKQPTAPPDEATKGDTTESAKKTPGPATGLLIASLIGLLVHSRRPR